MFKKKGFTLIELIMIIVILGVLAVVAIPKYVDLQAQAKVSAEKGVVGGVRAGIATFFVNQTPPAYPTPTLETAVFTGSCNATQVCFDRVLQQGGITSDWSKATATTYTGPTGTVYTYTAATGDFK